MDLLDKIPLVALPALFFLLLLGAEALLPLRRRTRGRVPRWGVNLAMTLLVFVAGTFLLKPVVNSLIGRGGGEPGGVLALLGIGSGAAAVAGFLLMDLSFYWWHRANHEVKLLWRFHAVHHVDPDVDVTTSFRFHFGEIILSIGFRIVQVLAIGITPATYAVYELCFTCGTIFHHSNLRLPLWLERPLNLVVVTPRMHGIHHSAWKTETNSNYSVLFRLWDTLHSSARLNVPQRKVEIGVPGYSGAGDNSLGALLALPFGKTRDWWQQGGEPRLEREFPGTGGSNLLAR